MEKVKIGIIGCGNISSVYLKNCSSMFDNLEVVACADIDPEKARIKALEFGVPKACTVRELLSDDEIAIVLNLTVHKAHAEINLAALGAGKNIYSEKPLAVTKEDGRKVLETAKAKGLKVGCAPDTFMGGGLQTCRRLIDEGRIGRPVAAASSMMTHGPECWHPNPEIFCETGAGPMFDMGPYYITALLNLLGPVKRISGSAGISSSERMITSKPKCGKMIEVKVPTHVVGVMEFENGAIGTLITSFDVWGTQLPAIEIYGTDGTLSVPDPNTFGGPVRIKGKDDEKWTEIPLKHSYIENCRGLGLSDMARGIKDARPHRANGELAYHTLEIMHGIYEAAYSGKYYFPLSSCERPEAL